MRKILLVRHASAVGDGQKRFVGVTNVGLSPEGCAEAAMYAMRLAQKYVGSEKKPVVWTSSLDRAKMTAEIIADMLGAGEVHVSENMREVSFGDWENLAVDEVSLRHAEEYGQWKSDPANYRIRHADTYIEGGERLLGALRKALEETAAEEGGEAPELIVVTHSGVMHGALCLIGALDFDKFFELKIKNCEEVELSYDEETGEFSAAKRN